MFTDLSDAQLEALRVSLRTAWLALIGGGTVAEIRYGEMGEKYHPADAKATETFLARVIAEQVRRAGGAGALFPAGV